MFAVLRKDCCEDGRTVNCFEGALHRFVPRSYQCVPLSSKQASGSARFRSERLDHPTSSERVDIHERAQDEVTITTTDHEYPNYFHQQNLEE